MNLYVTPERLSGTVSAPPSKSYAHRYIIAAYLSGTETLIRNAGKSKDVYATLGALQSAGLRYKETEDGIYIRREQADSQPVLYCKESGSTLRFLIPVMCALGINAHFTGEQSLLSRPIDELAKVINEHGANFNDLSVRGKLSSGRYEIDGSVSSQYISGLIFALPLLSSDSDIVLKNGVVSKRYIDITCDVVKRFGISVKETEYGWHIPGNQTYTSPKELTVEGDYSGAAFMLCAGALGGPVTVTGLNMQSKQGDKQILNVIKQFGANVELNGNGVTVSKKNLNGITVDIDQIPDLAQIIAVTAAYAKGKTVLKNVGRLKLKESNRIKAITDMLEKAGVGCCKKDNDIMITGGAPHGAEFDGGNDHRTVMSAAILGAYASKESFVSFAEAVDKSYPEFINDFISIGGKARVGI